MNRRYAQHRRLVSHINDLSGELDAESRRFERGIDAKRNPKKSRARLTESTAWLQHAFRSLLMAIVALKPDHSHKRATKRPRPNDCDETTAMNQRGILNG